MNVHWNYFFDLDIASGEYFLDDWFINKYLYFTKYFHYVSLDEVRTLNEDLFGYLPQKLFLTNHRDFLNDFLYLVCYDDLRAHLSQLHQLHIWYFNLYRDLLNNVDYLVLADYLSDLSFYFSVLRVRNNVRNTDFNLFELLSSFVDVARNFHSSLHFHYLLLTCLHDSFHLSHLHLLNYPLHRHLQSHFLSLVHRHCLFSHNWHLHTVLHHSINEHFTSHLYRDCFLGLHRYWYMTGDHSFNWAIYKHWYFSVENHYFSLTLLKQNCLFSIDGYSTLKGLALIDRFFNKDRNFDVLARWAEERDDSFNVYSFYYLVFKQG